MRIALFRFLKMSHLSLRVLCAPIKHNDLCLITLRDSNQLTTPVIASDGRVYDAKALQEWLSMSGSSHVVPGCPIQDVQIHTWPNYIGEYILDFTRTVWHTSPKFTFDRSKLRVPVSLLRMYRKVCPNKNVPLWKRVYRYHHDTHRIGKKLRGRSRFVHHSNSSFLHVNP
jgi:hypothetical protein